MVLIQIAAPPGPLCDQAEERIRQVISEHELECAIERISDFDAIVDLQVFAIPGLIVDGVLKSVGRVPEIAELVDWLNLDDSEKGSPSLGPGVKL